MMIPPYIRPGATVGITCPSGYLAAETIRTAACLLENRGYRVQTGATAGTAYHYFSGEDNSRLEDLQHMLDDPEIHVILMGRGGYGMSRIIDRLDFTGFRQRPKWICGFSDITLLHQHVHAVSGIATLHSPMCSSFRPETANAPFLQSFFDALSGIPVEYPVPPSPYSRQGVAEGILTGGNLALLAHAVGSSSEVDTEGKILFIEDVGEYLYSTDRMLMQLKRAGKLDRLAGLVVGGFTDMKDTDRPFGQEIEAIIRDKTEGCHYPVCFHFPAGHVDENYSLMLGTPHRLTVGPTGGSLLRLTDAG